MSFLRRTALHLSLGLPLSIAALRVGLTQGVVVAPKMHPWQIGW
jgi:hypothetical protein